MNIVEGIKHGYSGYNHHGCECPACRSGYRRYRSNVRRQKAYGRWQPFVDAEPVRAHARALMAVGVGWRRITELAKVPARTTNHLLFTRAGKKPAQRIRPELARRILAIPVTPLMAARPMVDAIGTQRRIQAMAAMDWSLTDQAKRLGWKRETFYSTFKQAKVLVTTAKAVAALYDELSMERAPQVRGTAAVRRMVARNRWFPPLAWDCDGAQSIDNPAAVPCLMPPVVGSDPAADEWQIQHWAAGHDHTLTRVDEVEIARRLLAAGTTLTDISSRLRRSPSWVAYVRREIESAAADLTTSEEIDK